MSKNAWWAFQFISILARKNRTTHVYWRSIFFNKDKLTTISFTYLTSPTWEWGVKNRAICHHARSSLPTGIPRNTGLSESGEHTNIEKTHDTVISCSISNHLCLTLGPWRHHVYCIQHLQMLSTGFWWREDGQQIFDEWVKWKWAYI